METIDRHELLVAIFKKKKLSRQKRKKISTFENEIIKKQTIQE